MRAPRPWIISVALAVALAAPFAEAQDSGRGDPARGPSTALTKTLEVPAVSMSVRYPGDWTLGPARYVNAQELWFVPPQGNAARIMITSERRLDHADAVNRLLEIASEEPATSTMLEIGGWPGLQRRQLALKPKRGHVVDLVKGEEKILRMTTAIAAGDRIVRLEASVPPEREKDLAPIVESIGRSATFARRGDPDAVTREIRDLMRRHAMPRSDSGRFTVPASGTSEELSADAAAGGPGAAVRALTRGAEISITVSNDGRNVVVATNSGYTVSSDAGVTFSALRFPTFPPAPYRVNGDPSVAIGASGAFYYALIGFPTSTQNATAVTVSTDNGQNFAFRSHAVVCTNESTPPAPPIPGACFADQEHIAADRFNTGAGGGDQVYSTWRNFDATDQDPALVCTQDSANNWSGVTNVGSGLKPRIGVGQDGFVYVIYLSGNNVMLNKFSSCANGLAAQAGFPRVVATIAEVTCPVPGLDRCTGRNTLASYTVDVDDNDPNHVYASFATNTANNVNENVLVRDSVDGGTTWPAARVVQLNGGGNARRFMPWMCTLGGTAHVTWYDRRNAVATNDLTDFYRGSASVSGGNLVAGPEVRVTQVPDPHCASGWPCATDRITDSESCSVQPQPAGVCKLNPIPNPDTSSNTRCDFSDCGTCSGGMCVGTANACGSDADCTRSAACACPSNENCTNGRGCPKYGDYNYSACAAGRIYSVWASATNPPDVSPPTPPDRIDTFLNVELVCCVSRISAPAAVTLPPTCAGATGTAPVSVCNTGFTDLVVTGISSSNAQFSVTAAFPATIAAGACQSFTARFSPTSRGPKSATFTIASNDPVTPSATVAATGLGQGLESITCPADRNVGNDPGLCSAVVDPGTPTVQADGCPVTIAGLRSDSLPLTAPYPVGTTTIAWTATDGGNNSLSCNQAIVVNDVEPPVISNLAAHPAFLWPPNHQMRMVEIAYDVTDNCDGPEAITCVLTVASNESPNGRGDGNTVPDWEVVDAHHVRLRAERSGPGLGREYTILATCTDSKKNSSSAAVTVAVRHNQ